MPLNIDLFKIRTNNVLPRKGKILIAEPFLSGNYFNRSIVFLVEHGREGTVGFILNKPVDFDVVGFNEEFPNFKERLYVGGPVNIESVYYIHTMGDLIPDSVEIMDGLFWGGDFDHLKDLISTGFADNSKVRFFLGYSGWDNGQLDEELDEDSWLVADISPKIVMKANDELWKEMVKQLGGKYSLWENFPENPALN